MIRAAVLTCMVVTAQPRAEPTLELQLQPLKATVKRGESAAVRVMVRTEPSMFQPLMPGQFFGEDIALDSEKWGFDMVPGTYTVSATVASEAQSWFDGWLKKHHKNEAGFERDDLFVGPIGSPPVTIQVIE